MRVPPPFFVQISATLNLSILSLLPPVFPFSFYASSGSHPTLLPLLKTESYYREMKRKEE